MQEHALNLLVLSHAYVVPHLKRECERQLLERGLITTDNVVDIFQLALLCDAPRLSLFCHRFMLKRFKAISSTQGWEAMKKSHPCKYAACKGLELLIRHFAGCKMRVSCGCIHCKRMWQVLELHSRLCSDSDVCRVPLCRFVGLVFCLEYFSRKNV